MAAARAARRTAGPGRPTRSAAGRDPVTAPQHGSTAAGWAGGERHPTSVRAARMSRWPVPGPLQNLRVVELAGIGPAPFAAMVLADLGADVLRVDRPGGQVLGFARPEHDLLNRGRRNVRSTSSIRAARRGARPGRAGRPADRELPPRAWPSGWASGRRTCWARNPRLVYGRMTGWGQTGPLASQRWARRELHRDHRSPGTRSAGPAVRRRCR